MIKAVMTNPYSLMNEGNKINGLFESGLDFLHIRKPKVSKSELAELIQSIDPAFHEKLILHNRFALCNDFKIRGVHLSPSDRDNVWVTKIMIPGLRIKSPKLKISTSYSKPRSLKSVYSGSSHVLLGPVYGAQPIPSIMFKKTIDKVRSYIDQSPVPVLAMGGISTDVIPFLHQAGFQGLCLQRAVWKTVDPVRSFIDCVNRFEELGDTGSSSYA